jgi:hypothetical protein
MDMEQEIDEIVEKRLPELMSPANVLNFNKKTLKLAVLDGYKAGLEAAQKVYSS